MEQSPGIKRGGVLNVVRHEIELWCPAGAIPERLDIDLTGLEIGDGIHISDVRCPEGVSPVIRDRNFTIATIAAPSTGEKEVPEDAEEARPSEGSGRREGRAKRAKRRAERQGDDLGAGVRTSLVRLREIDMWLFVGLGNPGQGIRGSPA